MSDKAKQQFDELVALYESIKGHPDFDLVYDAAAKYLNKVKDYIEEINNGTEKLTKKGIATGIFKFLGACKQLLQDAQDYMQRVQSLWDRVSACPDKALKAELQTAVNQLWKEKNGKKVVGLQYKPKVGFMERLQATEEKVAEKLSALQDQDQDQDSDGDQVALDFEEEDEESGSGYDKASPSVQYLVELKPVVEWSMQHSMTLKDDDPNYHLLLEFNSKYTAAKEASAKCKEDNVPFNADHHQLEALAADVVALREKLSAPPEKKEKQKKAAAPAKTKTKAKAKAKNGGKQKCLGCSNKRVLTSQHYCQNCYGQNGQESAIIAIQKYAALLYRSLDDPEGLETQKEEMDKLYTEFVSKPKMSLPKCKKHSDYASAIFDHVHPNAKLMLPYAKKNNLLEQIAATEPLEKEKEESDQDDEDEDDRIGDDDEEEEEEEESGDLSMVVPDDEVVHEPGVQRSSSEEEESEAEGEEESEEEEEAVSNVVDDDGSSSGSSEEDQDDNEAEAMEIEEDDINYDSDAPAAKRQLFPQDEDQEEEESSSSDQDSQGEVVDKVEVPGQKRGRPAQQDQDQDQDELELNREYHKAAPFMCLNEQMEFSRLMFERNFAEATLLLQTAERKRCKFQLVGTDSRAGDFFLPRVLDTWKDATSYLDENKSLKKAFQLRIEKVDPADNERKRKRA